MTSYIEILNDAYEQMVAPREKDAPTVISTFAGGGGSSAGYHMAGYNEILAVEWDNNAVETLRLNFPHLDVYHGDIAKLSVEEVLGRTGLSAGDLDVFDGSPPCQGFSTAGKRNLGDERNQLFREYVRLLRGLQPRVFVMENVSGMVKGKMKLLFVEILKELKASGYKVSARLLNAKYFHVPQSRERMIFIGVRDDLGIEPSHPRAESAEIPVGLTCDCESPHEYFSGKALDVWRSVPPGGNWEHVPPHIRGGRAKFSDFHRKLDSRKPSYTIPKTEHHVSGRFYHWGEPRYISDLEMMRIGGFPSGFRCASGGSLLQQRIGNSVPPLMMRAIARHIKAEILDHTGIKPERIE